MHSSDSAIVAAVRSLSGVSAAAGPDDEHILAGVKGFVDAFDFWYGRVIGEAVPKYRNVIIARVNPFIRRVELVGLDARDCARQLVGDYARRNFVTAGGWALERMAIEASPDAQKSTAEGIDAQRHDPATSDYHLYVLKSGLVTRNSDIIKGIKLNGRRAEKLLKQGGVGNKVHLNYAILSGKVNSSFEDGVHRPSSGEFWGEMFGLPQEEAIELALAIAAEAGKLVTRGDSPHIAALESLVASYMECPVEAGAMDWEFLAKRNMQKKDEWKSEDAVRHKKAWATLLTSGYAPLK
ncbi:PmeII family type II restriction endonuclease [Streptomyces anthocyanicus]|uniref:PmeII family type II restriction endonuclease n=1 Tax=Streptomyces anthocyanicus TaxID=68174 RepID=UPI0036484C85